MSEFTYNAIDETVLDAIFSNEDLVPQGVSMKFTKKQGPATGDDGRVFMVSGPKADKVRQLIFAGLSLTRKQIADFAGCSVSRVGEVIWGLQYDAIEFPEIPLREVKEPAAEETVDA